MDGKVQQSLNDQIRHELESAYVYLAMCAHFEAENLPGFAHWMKLQAQEEVGHAMRLFEFMHDRGARVTLQAIPQPPNSFESPLSVFEQALDHERHITRLIDECYAAAREAGDTATQVMLQWFVTEQVEEEKNAGLAADQLKLAGNDRAALLFLDRQMAQRTAED